MCITRSIKSTCVYEPKLKENCHKERVSQWLKLTSKNLKPAWVIWLTSCFSSHSHIVFSQYHKKIREYYCILQVLKKYDALAFQTMELKFFFIVVCCIMTAGCLICGLQSLNIVFALLEERIIAFLLSQKLTFTLHTERNKFTISVVVNFLLLKSCPYIM